jgi:hypothetical protein
VCYYIVKSYVCCTWVLRGFFCAVILFVEFFFFLFSLYVVSFVVCFLCVLVDYVLEFVYLLAVLVDCPWKVALPY